MPKSKARILVVEDDSALLRGLMDVLVFNGFDASGVADGAEYSRPYWVRNYEVDRFDILDYEFIITFD